MRGRSEGVDVELAIMGRPRNITVFDGRDGRGLAVRTQIETQNEVIEKVFRKIQATLTLNVVFKISVPVTRLLQFHGVVREIQSRQSGVRRHGRQLWPLLHGGI